jgi:phosphocarrier protein
LNEKGLHARAATLLVQTANKFDADLTVEKDGQTVNGKSVMSILILAAVRGSTITVEARGPQSEQALDAVANLIARKFDED